MLDNCLTKHCITNIFDSLLFLGTFEVLIGIATVIYSDYREGLKTAIAVAAPGFLPRLPQQTDRLLHAGNLAEILHTAMQS